MKCLVKGNKNGVRLITAISPSWAEVIKTSYINPPNLFNLLATEAFIEGKTGPAVDALRRVCKSLRDCSVYRMTPEFDKLCEF